METLESLPSVSKRTVTPKALLHQKYGERAVYKIEKVESAGNDCPGLVIPQSGHSLFRCCLELPDCSVTSDTFTKKKDAEQSAAKMAIEKLGIIQPKTENLTVQETWDVLVARLSYLFSDEFLSSSHPLVGHFRAAVQREGDIFGLLPISVLATYDSRVNNLCKSINPRAELSPSLTIAIVMKAARLSDSVYISEGTLWVCKQHPHSPDCIQALVDQGLDPTERIQIEAVYIPCSLVKPVEPFHFYVSSKEYYMDVVAKRLGLSDYSRMLVSRTIGKASSEMRLYFSAPDDPLFSSDSSVDVLSHATDCINTALELNERASYFSGQKIYGDAVMSIVGYMWKSTNLFHKDVSLDSYYRVLIGRTPSGNYKLSREAILAAELPTLFTLHSNWRGSLPRDLLCMFCRQHRLLEPVFMTKVIDHSEHSSEILEECKRLKLSSSMSGRSTGEVNDITNGKSVGNGSSFGCEVKILSRGNDVIIEYSTEDLFRKQSDAIHSAALKVLNYLNKYFKELDISVEELTRFGDAQGVHVYPDVFTREFMLCRSAHNHWPKSILKKCCSEAHPNKNHENGISLIKIEGPDSGSCPSIGSLVCISYSVSLLRDGHSYLTQPLESGDDFQFEVGVGAVIHQLEACVMQLSLNQNAQFVTEIPSEDLILASAGESTKLLLPLSLQDCCLEYSVQLLQITEPLEDRMEQALFSPPLSKQRVDYALKHIYEANATSLVDFGCGSGSLLDSLLDHPTSLEKIVGVDISQKGLCRAAKMLHSKLSVNSTVRTAVLYEGSITDFDSRLYGFDIGTCLEVIEHMEEDQACIFGDVVLSCFCPEILLVSTPNYEYNSILQKTVLSSRGEEDPDVSTQSQPFKFRNHDHKFEWTREQFNSWALDLASRHNYSVEFSGVGGSADVEPGFASQIAVFQRKSEVKDCSNSNDSANIYEDIWEWSNNRPRSAI
ncbi:small RNA 2'-O-methyltransferase [Aristolochia californica]|uniref:small RNA 2'-O-methyltransferase n=1 Tax=Aristolochia californica TaxID=171875 RepID=UPI0035DA7AEB